MALLFLLILKYKQKDILNITVNIGIKMDFKKAI